MSNIRSFNWDFKSLDQISRHMDNYLPDYYLVPFTRTSTVYFTDENGFVDVYVYHPITITNVYLHAQGNLTWDMTYSRKKGSDPKIPVAQ